jgi:hypothetical protein
MKKVKYLFSLQRIESSDSSLLSAKSENNRTSAKPSAKCASLQLTAARN